MIAPLFSGWLQVCNAKRRARPLTRCQWCWAVRLVPAGCSCPGNRAAWQARMQAIDEWSRRAAEERAA